MYLPLSFHYKFFLILISAGLLSTFSTHIL